MKDRPDEIDAGMEGRLEALASSSPTPPLPSELLDLPWAVQRPRSRLRQFSDWRAAFGGFGHASLGLARLAVTLVFAVLAVSAVAVVRSGSGPAAPGAGEIRTFETSLPSPAVAGPSREVVVVQANGEVDESMTAFIDDGLSRAYDDKAQALVIVLDTPGGTLSSMTDITKALLASRVPTVVWVGPSGARAASAGTFIALAANFNLMAPATHIGAASPIDSNGQDIPGTLGVKVMQDAIAQIRSIAERRHPKAADWAQTTVQNARSYTADEAIAAGAADGTATSVQEVVNWLDGKTATIATAGGGTTQVAISTAGATIVNEPQDPFQLFLRLLRDPNLVFVLLVIGVLAVLIELFHPTLLAGFAGILALSLSFYGSGSLPLNILGVVLVVLGISMLALEASIPSHGLLTVGGLICFVAGAMAFYGTPGPFVPAVTIATPVIVTMTLIAAAYGLILVRTLIGLRKHAPLTAGSGMIGTVTPIGATGEVRRSLNPTGTVYAVGEAWSARTTDGATVPTGTLVRIVGQDGLTLVVEPVPEPARG